MRKPTYSVTIPSLEDDTLLDCRIYHPQSLVDGLHLSRRGAVVAHPYAPLGGCYDDPVVLSAVECLLDIGLFVGTFNFRGAYGSHGRTSWTGKPEKADYISFIGLMICYLQQVDFALSPGTPVASPPVAVGSTTGTAISPALVTKTCDRKEDINLILGGYSYGSIILSNLPSMGGILQRFSAPLPGTAASEIKLRARNLACQTSASLRELRSPVSPRGQQLLLPEHPIHRYTREPPIVVGGEETDPKERRRSREAERSVDIVRKSFDTLWKNRTNAYQHRSSHDSKHTTKAQTIITSPEGMPKVKISYLLISLVLPPISYALCLSRTMLPSKVKDNRTLSENRTLAIFGSSDAITSASKMRSWAEKLAGESNGLFQSKQIDGAGHFWREEGVMSALKGKILAWVKEEPP